MKKKLHTPTLNPTPKTEHEIPWIQEQFSWFFSFFSPPSLTFFSCLVAAEQGQQTHGFLQKNWESGSLNFALLFGP